MAKPKILLTRRWPASVEDRLATAYDVTLNDTDTPLDEPALKRAMADFDALCPTVTDRLNATLFRPGQRVKIIANYGAGHEHIDLEAAGRAGVTVTNADLVVVLDGTRGVLGMSSGIAA